MTTLICDTSGLLAAFDATDVHHQTCASALSRHTGPLAVSPLVVAEMDHLVRRRHGGTTARQVLTELSSGAFILADLSVADLEACAKVDERYADLNLGVTDCHLVVLANARGTAQLLTLDERHFRAVKPLAHGKAFRLLPADGPERRRRR